jgi:hypothetical protein
MTSNKPTIIIIDSETGPEQTATTELLMSRLLGSAINLNAILSAPPGMFNGWLAHLTAGVDVGHPAPAWDLSEASTLASHVIDIQVIQNDYETLAQGAVAMLAGTAWAIGMYAGYMIAKEARATGTNQ